MKMSFWFIEQKQTRTRRERASQRPLGLDVHAAQVVHEREPEFARQDAVQRPLLGKDHGHFLAALAQLFPGKLEVDDILHIGFRGVDIGHVRVIDTRGRPVIAAPAAVPTITSSEIGVLRMRFDPNICRKSPLSARDLPPMVP